MLLVKFCLNVVSYVEVALQESLPASIINSSVVFQSRTMLRFVSVSETNLLGKLETMYDADHFSVNILNENHA